MQLSEMHGTGKVKSLIDVLTEESQTTIIWLKENGVIVNPPRFQIMFVSKTKNTTLKDLKTSVLMT